MVYLFLANGFEESEALVPLDILRRGGVEIKTVGVDGKTVTGSHNITVSTDITADEVVLDTSLEAIILPGGMPGTLNLEKSETVGNAINFAVTSERLIAAICAAPSILGHKNLLFGKKAVCYPGFEKELFGAVICDKPCVRDGNIITAIGAGAAFDFGLSILSYLKGEKAAETVKKAMKYKGEING